MSKNVTVRNLKGFLLSSIILSALALPERGFCDVRTQATRLFDRLANAPLSLTDPRRAQMETLISQGRYLEAAQIATADDSFYNITVRSFATPMSNRPEDPVIAQAMGVFQREGPTRLTDFIAMFIGSTRDNMNAQELLNGDFTYYVTDTIAGVEPYTPRTYSDSKHYDQLDKNGVNLRQRLVRITPQNPILNDAAGVITSQAWGHQHFNGGTNRRVVHFALRQFLCTDIEAVRDGTLSPARIRRDVDRLPGGNAAIFQTKCLTCHAGMDGLAGAFAYYDLVHIFPGDVLPGQLAGDQIMKSTRVRDKMNRNSNVYPDGYVTVDDSWVNNFAASRTSTNLEIGWPANMTSGNGPRSLGTMLANTRAFPVCMTKRVFKKVCGRAPTDADRTAIDTLATQFVSGGYRLKSLFENTAILPTCLGN